MILQLTFCKGNSEQVASFTKVKLGLEAKLDWAREPPLPHIKVLTIWQLTLQCCHHPLTQFHSLLLPSLFRIRLAILNKLLPLTRMKLGQIWTVNIAMLLSPSDTVSLSSFPPIQNQSCNSEQVTSPYQSEIGAGRHTVRLGQEKTQ